jgi:hypothetical protein
MIEVRSGARVPTASQYHSSLKAVIKRAIIVLDALGDSEMRFQNQGQVWNRAINDAALAYGYSHWAMCSSPQVTF